MLAMIQDSTNADFLDDPRLVRQRWFLLAHQELWHENTILSHQLITFESRRAPVEDSPWQCIIHHARDAEEVFIATHSTEDFTKVSLARQLQTRDGFTDAERNRLWGLPKATLLHQCGY